MSDSLTQEKDDWEDLVGRPGWTRLIDAADSRWLSADAFRRRVTAAAKSPQVDKELAAVTAATEAVADLLALPQTRLQGIRQSEVEGKRREDDPFRAVRRVP